MKRTKDFLEKENKWLWWWHIGVPDEAELIETKAFNKRGKMVYCSTATLPSKKYRPVHPNAEKERNG